MTPNPDPAAAVPQATPPAETTATIPLAPLPAAGERFDPALFAAELARLDRVLAAVVLVFAFFLGSFVARNTDLWMHLATGRLLAQGQLPFGVDPFAYTTEGVTWVNHAWLFDLVLYGLAALGGGPETAAGGALLVICKALLLVALAWVLLQVRRPEQSLWIPAVCTALALLALSPRALLQPTVVSFLFLGLTLYLLTRRDGRRWLLPPLFLLWVNLDSWFFLGSLTVALYLVGETIQATMAPVYTGEDAPVPGERRTLLLVLVVGLVACLVNPYHVRAFTWPAELYGPTLNAIHDRDAQLFYFHSPLDKDWFSEPSRGRNLAGLAYYPLLLLGAGSFALHRAGLRWWRVLVWLVFALLSAYQVRAVPFFAVVGGPILALNLQDYALHRLGSGVRTERGWRQWALGGRILSVALVLVLIAAAWPGWLHARPDNPRVARRVGWAVEVDPSLASVARQMHAWHEQGLLGKGEHGFALIPDVNNYLAWFCPEEKGFFDYRFSLFPHVARAYVDLRQGLRGTAARDPGDFGPRPTATVSVPRVFGEHRINHVIVYENDPAATEVKARLLSDPYQWPLLYLDGRSAVFAWREPGTDTVADLVRARAFRPAEQAFGRDLPEAERAPRDGPGRMPRRVELWSRYWQGLPPRPLDADTALAYMDYFQHVSQKWLMPYLASMHVGNWAGTAALTAAGCGTGGARVTAAMLYRFPLEPYVQDEGQGPPAPLVVALRAARRAVAESPDHAQAYLFLANAYFFLWQAEEDPWADRTRRPPLSLRQTFRLVQLVTALHYALYLRPDADDAHLLLSEVYGQVGHLDSVLEHMRAALQVTTDAGPRPREPLEQYENRRKEAEKRVEELTNEIKSRMNQYEVSAANKPAGTKAQIALELGLAREALKVLLEADPTQVGPYEADLQLRLLILEGRGAEVRERLSPEFRGVMDGVNYEWYHALAAAAAGDYGQAGKYLDEAIVRLQRGTLETAAILLRRGAFQGVVSPSEFLSLMSLPNGTRQIAEFRAVRGLVALEEGDIAMAAAMFRASLDSGGPTHAQGERHFPFESRPIVLRYLREIANANP